MDQKKGLKREVAEESEGDSWWERERERDPNMCFLPVISGMEKGKRWRYSGE